MVCDQDWSNKSITHAPSVIMLARTISTTPQFKTLTYCLLSNLSIDNNQVVCKT